MSQYVTTPDGKRHIFPDSASKEQIAHALSSYARPQSAGFGGFPAAVNPYNPASVMDQLKSKSLELLPTAGGMAGGMIGAYGGFPGAVAGAGIGGAAGEAAKEYLGGKSVSPLAVGGSGLEQASYEAGGRALVGGASKLAGHLMKGALRPGALLKKFPDIVETALSERTPVSAGGAEKARSLRTAASKQLYGLLGEAKSAGKSFLTSDVAKHARALLDDPVLPSDAKAQIAKELEQFIADKGVSVDPVLLKGIKKYAQANARPIYNAAASGDAVAQANRARFYAALGTGAKEQLETIPGVGAAESRTKSLIGLQRATGRAEMRSPPRFRLIEPTTYPILNALTGPSAASHMAIWLKFPWFRTLLGQSPRLAMAIAQQPTTAPADVSAVGRH